MSLHAPVPPRIDARDFSFELVAARFNARWVDQLVDNCLETLKAAGADPARLRLTRVPGSHEVPWAVARILETRQPSAVIALGVLLRGATNHHELVANVVAQAVVDLAVRGGAPVINGVMAVDSEQQADDRCGPVHNRGREFAFAALEMAQVARSLSPRSGNASPCA